MKLRPSDVPAAWELLKSLLLQIEGEVGPDLRDGLKGTPHRVLRAWEEQFSGYHVDVPALFKTFEEPGDSMVVLKSVEIASTCEHHMLPFLGKAHVGYIPQWGKVVGVSKLARVIDAYAKRLQIQERIGRQVTQAITLHLSPHAACVIEAKHLCMVCRGVGKQNSVMVTSSITGEFVKPEVRSEFLRLIGK